MKRTEVKAMVEKNWPGLWNKIRDEITDWGLWMYEAGRITADMERLKREAGIDLKEKTDG